MTGNPARLQQMAGMHGRGGIRPPFKRLGPPGEDPARDKAMRSILVGENGPCVFFSL